MNTWVLCPPSCPMDSVYRIPTDSPMTISATYFLFCLRRFLMTYLSLVLALENCFALENCLANCMHLNSQYSSGMGLHKSRQQHSN
mmetsp:Transcript_113333/g.208174  ORF Transcript_113333/g.208174 Transcript_113333/m.208174 type:complete len:86 (+) Transcript_113333:1248-1505(+)